MTSSSKRKTILDLFPVPEFLMLSTMGVAITDRDIKFVQLRRELFGNGFELTHATKIKTPKGAVEGGLITNPTELAAALEKTVSHYGLHYAHAILPEEKAYLFTTTIDWVSEKGLRDAVAFIIEENVPVTLAESVFDFEIVNVDTRAGKIKLTVSVLPRSVVNSYIELFKSVGIVPASFRLESQSIARAIVSSDDMRPQLIINLSWGKTGFYVVENGFVQFSTTLAYGMGEDNSLPNPNDLKAELRKVLTFWNLRSDKTHRSSGESGPSPLEKKITKAILCGPGAGEKEFVEKLMKGHDVEYSFADIWLNMSPRRHIAEMSFEESLNYIPALGLVLSQQR